MVLVDIFKAGPGVLWWLSLLLQDAPLSDCTETIEGLEFTEQTFSPAKSVSFRKVLTALSLPTYWFVVLFSLPSPNQLPSLGFN